MAVLKTWFLSNLQNLDCERHFGVRLNKIRTYNMRDLTITLNSSRRSVARHPRTFVGKVDGPSRTIGEKCELAWLLAIVAAYGAVRRVKLTVKVDFPLGVPNVSVVGASSDDLEGGRAKI
jgi:hypothetical protein